MKVAEDNDLPMAAIESFLDFEKVGRKSQIGKTYHDVIKRNSTGQTES